MFDLNGIGKPAGGFDYMTGKLLVDCKILEDAMKGGGGDIQKVTRNRAIKSEFRRLYGNIAK
jgi:hypothetical protein